jgi:hypothetical protein
MSANDKIQVPESDTTRHGARRWLSRGVAVVYGLVMFEVVIMVSPSPRLGAVYCGGRTVHLSSTLDQRYLRQDRLTASATPVPPTSTKQEHNQDDNQNRF